MIGILQVQETANPSRLMGMQLITEENYRKFISDNQHVKIENVDVEIGRPWRIKEFGPAKDYKPEEFTVWSFPSRGDWATHSGNYRGNWSPYIPRNLITKYSKQGQLVLVQMCGNGTTLVESKLLGRDGIRVDVNSDAIMVAQDRLSFDYNTLDKSRRAETRPHVGSARNLDLIGE